MVLPPRPMSDTSIDALLDNAARDPYRFHKVLDIKDYRAVMLRAQAEFTAGGYRWSLVGKPLGASLYELTAKRKTA